MNNRKLNLKFRFIFHSQGLNKSARDDKVQEDAGRHLKKLEESRKKADSSIVGKALNLVDTLNPMPEPRTNPNAPEVKVRKRPVPQTEAELLAAAKNSRLFGPDQQLVLKRARGKLIGSVYQSWKAGLVNST